MDIISLRSILLVSFVTISPGIFAENDNSLKTTKAQYVSIDHVITLDAKVEAVNRSTLSAQTDGRVTATLVDVGDLVEKNTLILQLRDTEQQAALKQAKASVEGAQAQWQDAEKEYIRIKDLHERGLVSQSALDHASSNRSSTLAKLKSAQALQDTREQQLEYTRVRAPFTGIVEKRMVEVGELVHSGTPLYSGMSLDLVRVVASVSQTDIDAVRHYRKAIVELNQVTPEPNALQSTTQQTLDDQTPPGLSNASNPGSQATFSPTGQTSKVEVSDKDITFFAYADPETSSFKVRVELPPGQQGLYPGMYLKTSFKIGERQALIIPQSAVVHRASMTAIYVLNNQQIEFRQVRLGEELPDNQIEVLAGLVEGEQVALEPHVALSLREQVRMKTEQ